MCRNGGDWGVAGGLGWTGGNLEDQSMQAGLDLGGRAGNFRGRELSISAFHANYN